MRFCRLGWQTRLAAGGDLNLEQVNRLKDLELEDAWLLKAFSDASMDMPVLNKAALRTEGLRQRDARARRLAYSAHVPGNLSIAESLTCAAPGQRPAGGADLARRW